MSKPPRRVLQPNPRRCDHDPRRPRFDLTVEDTRGKNGSRGKPFPWLIRQFLERLPMLYTERSLFPELGPRKRSQRIEVMVLVGKAIGRNLDRLTLRSGRRNPDGTFTGITMKTIANWAKVSIQRANRAVWDLRDAGYVTLTQPIEKRPDGSRRGHAGIRQVSKHLFERLGLGGRLKRERRDLWKEERSRQTAMTIARRREMRRTIRESRRAAVLTNRTTKQLAERKSAAPVFDLEARKAELAEQIRQWQARQPKPE